MNNFASKRYAVREVCGEKEVVIRTYIENGVEKRKVEAIPTSIEAFNEIKAAIAGQKKKEVVNGQNGEQIRYKKEISIEKIPCTYYVVIDTKTKKIIAKDTNLETIATASDNDLLFVCGYDEEKNKPDKKYFTHLQINAGKGEIKAQFEDLDDVVSSANHKTWILDSKTNGPAIYNAKTKELLYAKQLAPEEATSLQFNLQDEDHIELSYDIIKNDISDTITTLIDYDNFNCVETSSINRPTPQDCPSRESTLKKVNDATTEKSSYTGYADGELYKKHIKNNYIESLEKASAFIQSLENFSSTDLEATLNTINAVLKEKIQRKAEQEFQELEQANKELGLIEDEKPIELTLKKAE